MKNFSFNRLMQLIKKQGSEDRKMYVLSSIALFGILGVVFAFWIFGGGNTYREETLYLLGILGLFITGGIFASTSFASLNNKEKGVFSLAFPASHLEKLLTTLFFNVIVFTVVYALCFFLLKFIAEAAIAARIANNDSYRYVKANWIKKGSLAKSIPILIYAFFALQSLFILGSIIFKRFAFVITAIIIIVLFFSWLFFSNKLMGTLYGREEYNFLFSEIRKPEPSLSSYKVYELPASLQIVLGLILKYLLAPFFWLVTYFKLKEKQI